MELLNHVKVSVLLNKYTLITLEHSWLCQFQEYDMIRKFPCNCYKCEHESNANLKTKEASMKNAWLKTDFKCSEEFKFFHMLSNQH